MFGLALDKDGEENRSRDKRKKRENLERWQKTVLYVI